MTVGNPVLKNGVGYNKIKVNIAIILLLSFINMGFTKDVVKQKDSWPVADGTFIQPFLVKDWDDEKWLMELQYLKDTGMNYIVLASTADRISGDRLMTVYPTRMPGCHMYEDYNDIVDACLRNAERMGFKVFLGLNSDSNWWSRYAWDAEWLYNRMREGNAVADELYSLYYSKYPAAFYGWYWPWEVDNFHFKGREEQRVLANAINITLHHLESTGKRLPFMLSPYMNYWFGGVEEYKNTWINVFANTDFKEGDIFCPQDSVGAGGINLGDASRWFRAFRQAVDTKQGLLLWANVETFDISDKTSATLDRFVEQLKNVEPYADNIITFAYSHYYSPNVTNPGFHREYLYYVENGIIKDSTPKAPLNVRKGMTEDECISIAWQAPGDDMDICGYLVYRDGRLIKRIQVPRKEDDEGTFIPETVYIDRIIERDILTNYEIRTYDFWGNVSKKTAGSY